MSWKALEPWLSAPATDPTVRDALRRVVAAAGAAPPERRAALGGLLTVLQSSGESAGVLAALAAIPAPAAQRLALELAARLPPPLSPAILESLAKLLRDSRWPPPLRLAVTDQLLRSGVGPASAVRLLQGCTAGASRARARHRLRALRERVGPHPLLDDLLGRLEATRRLHCPRCHVELGRSEMVRHLWQDHGQMLAGHRVRDPWALVRDWVGVYLHRGTHALLERAAELAQQLDPANGLVRVQRLLRHRGGAELLPALRAEANRRGATLCPHCSALVPPPSGPKLPNPAPAHGRLALAGYSVAVSDRGVLSRLTIETPHGPLLHGREPGRTFTRGGALLLRGLPFVLLALLLALVWPSEWVPIAAVSVTLLAGAAFYLRGLWRWRNDWPANDRVIDHAWARLAPLLHPDNADDAWFLAGLARASRDHGRPLAREPGLSRTVQAMQTAVTAGRVDPALPVPLWRLELDDARRVGRDPILPLVAQLGPCLAGELPLRCAELLLAEGGCDDLLPGDRARLRVLLVARAFEAGLEVVDLTELGRVVPALASVLRTTDADGLARLRLLWSLRPARPWQHCGVAVTVFDLARYPALGGQHLQDWPDLLLFQPGTSDDRDGHTAGPVLICGSAVVYRDTPILEPYPVEVRGRTGDGYELVCGPHRFTFRGPPELPAARLRGWLRYLFADFLPRVDSVLAWHSAGPLPRLLGQRHLACPECGRSFLRREGDVGLPVAPPA